MVFMGGSQIVNQLTFMHRIKMLHRFKLHNNLTLHDKIRFEFSYHLILII